jgi:two-component system chemotaxis sensor kinase CheA
MTRPPESAWERELRDRLRAVFADEAAERLGALDAALLALEGGAAGADTEQRLTEAFRQAHTLKGGARAAGLPDVERVAHGLESAFDGLRQAGTVSPGGWGPIYAAVDALRALVGGRGADVDAVVAALEPPDPGAGSIPPPAARPRPAVPGGGEPAVATEAVRVPVGRLERLMADVRELHAGLSRLRLQAGEAREPDRSPAAPPRRGRHRLDTDIHRLEQVVADLGDSVRRLRMVPVGVALAGLPRLVRDTAAATGKEARLELVGDDTEVDRSVLDGISGSV